MKRMSFILFFAFYSFMAFAQEGSGGADLKVNVTKTDIGDGGSIPWLWIIGGIVLLVVLIALLNSRGGKDTIVEKRTVIKD